MRKYNNNKKTLLEGEYGQRSVGLVARVVPHLLAPEVVAKDVQDTGAGSDIWVVDHRPHIVVYQLPMKRVGVT